MNKKVLQCTVCSTYNEVKASSGRNNPANKGREYFSCIAPGCDSFHWVENGVPIRPNGAPQGQPEIQSTPQPTPPSTPWIPPVQKADTTDWDVIARGKVRSLLMEALITFQGLEELNDTDKRLLDKYVGYCMEGNW